MSARAARVRSTTTAGSFDGDRGRMVERQLVARGIRAPAVLRAMATVPREAFVPPAEAAFAYEDRALPIEEGQTISQPYVVAAMIAAAAPESSDRALEIGTGSGYSAAVLSTIVAEVFTVERLPGLASAAAGRLASLGYRNVRVRCGDGTLGWPEHAPYDVIVVTAGGPMVPPALLDQLAVGGRLVMPVGPSMSAQQLLRVVRTDVEEYSTVELEPVAFVPLIGAQGWPGGAPDVP